jgi:hypothetical protein
MQAAILSGAGVTAMQISRSVGQLAHIQFGLDRWPRMLWSPCHCRVVLQRVASAADQHLEMWLPDSLRVAAAVQHSATVPVASSCAELAQATCTALGQVADELEHLWVELAPTGPNSCRTFAAPLAVRAGWRRAQDTTLRLGPRMVAEA